MKTLKIVGLFAIGVGITAAAVKATRPASLGTISIQEDRLAQLERMLMAAGYAGCSVDMLEE